MAPAANAQTIYNIGVLPGDYYSRARAVSADGFVVTGVSDGTGSRMIRWTPLGIEDLGTSPGDTDAWGCAINADGSVIVGVSGVVHDGLLIGSAVRWTSQSGMEVLPAPQYGHGSAALAVSADGSVIAGAFDSAAGFRACSWTSEGMSTLGGLGGAHSRALAITPDGASIAGAAQDSSGTTRGFRWSQLTGMVAIESLPLATFMFPRGISADGTRIAGESELGAFLWTEGVGTQALGTIAGTTYSMARGITGDGRTVVGQVYGADLPIRDFRAFIWTETTGMVDLNVYLGSVGVDLTGWLLTDAHGVSDHGSVIVGDGWFDGYQRGWVAVIPTPGTFVAPLCLLGIGAWRRPRRLQSAHASRRT